jgi:inosose dehydratase
MQIACGGITWGSFARQKGIEYSREAVLAEIAQAGYAGAPFHVGDTRPASEIVASFAEYGLVPAPGYLGARFWDAGEEEAIIAQARQAAQLTQEVGCSEMYVAASPLTRREASGHVRPEDAMSEAEYVQFAETLNRVGEICLRYDVRICFHNHVGSVIETREEVDHLFSLVDRNVVFQGPDIGHLAWAGADAAQFVRDYARSIESLHIKDIDPDVLRQGVSAGWDYATFSQHGIFTELGEGFVDLASVVETLRDVDYDGWIIVETDVTQKDSPLESAIISRNYLKGLGL